MKMRQKEQIVYGDKRKTGRADYILLCVCIGFYLLFPLFDGPVWCVDSGGYADMHVSREPLYPVFLAFCRWSEGFIRLDWKITAVILQSLLAGFATWFSGYAIGRMKHHSRMIRVLTILCQFAVTLLCRFVAKRGSAYSDCILTEGLGFSLFLLFTVFLFLYIQSRAGKYLGLTMFTSFLLISLRKQMMITLLIMTVVFVWFELVRARRKKWFLCLIGMLFCVVLAGKLFDRTYQYAVRGVWMEHTGNYMGILCTLLYSSDVEEDRELFENEDVEELYLEIMKQAEEQRLLYAYANPGWLSVSSHFADSYDAIGYGIINPVVEGYVAEHFRYPEPEAAMKYDEICKEMSNTLSQQKRLPLLQVLVYNTWKGLVNSVARASRLLGIYAIAAYFTVVAATWYLAGKRRELERRLAGREKVNNGRQGQILCGDGREQIECIRQIDITCCFTFIVLAGILVNALAVGVVIFAQPRYMLYGMGMFYTAGGMLLYDSVRVRRVLSGVKTADRVIKKVSVE